MNDSYDLETMSLERLVDLRAWQKVRTDLVTAELKRRVITEHAEHNNIKKLAKKTGVTRHTIYSWLRQ
jgi:transposase-like protein